MRHAGRLIACLLALGAVGASHAMPSGAALSDSIEGGASENFFYIEPGYNGSSIVLFGSIDREKLRDGPFDVAVTVRGPAKPVTVWKKAPHAGLWINSDRLAFEAVPNYYAVLSTRPVSEIASAEERKARGLGLDALAFAARPGGDKMAAPEEFQKELIRLKQSGGLFLEQSEGAIELLGARLFRAHIHLPASGL